MAKYRKKPVIIEAVKVLETINKIRNHEKIPKWFNSDNLQIIGNKVIVSTLEGLMIANEDDYIIKGVNGELYPCKPDIFEKTYELVGDQMNLLEHYIEKILSVVDVTKEWEEYIQEEDPNFVETDPMLEIKVLINCMGVEEYRVLWYHKSEWDKTQEQGYYMA